MSTSTMLAVETNPDGRIRIMQSLADGDADAWCEPIAPYCICTKCGGFFDHLRDRWIAGPCTEELRRSLIAAGATPVPNCPNCAVTWWQDDAHGCYL